MYIILYISAGLQLHLLKKEASRVITRSEACQKFRFFCTEELVFLVTLNIESKKNIRSC